jgi:hypothetical protein
MDDLKLFLFIFGLLKLLPRDAAVTGIVRNVRNAVSMFG